MAPQALYQVVLLGAGRATHGPAFRTRLEALAADIGDDVRAALRVFEPSQIGSIVPTAPLVAVYFGGDPSVDEDEAARLCAAAVPIVPVVDDLADYPAKTPAALHPVNGMAIGTIAVDYTAVVNVVLENLALLRRSRRLFLSYLRKESSAVAHQLRVAFDDGGYDTFLDLSSVPKSDDFQAVLWHRLLDSDVLIVLDTPNFLSSKWTRQELAQAAAMSVGMLRVVWPDIDTKDEAVAPLAEVLYLDGADFDGDHLTADALRRVTRGDRGAARALHRRATRQPRRRVLCRSEAHRRDDRGAAGSHRRHAPGRRPHDRRDPDGRRPRRAALSRARPTVSGDGTSGRRGGPGLRSSRHAACVGRCIWRGWTATCRSAACASTDTAASLAKP